MEQAEKLKSREKLKPLNGGKDGGGCGESGDKVVMIRWNESFKHSDGLTDKGTFVILVSLSSLKPSLLEYIQSLSFLNVKFTNLNI